MLSPHFSPCQLPAIRPLDFVACAKSSSTVYSPPLPAFDLLSCPSCSLLRVISNVLALVAALLMWSVSTAVMSWFPLCELLTDDQFLGFFVFVVGWINKCFE